MFSPEQSAALASHGKRFALFFRLASPTPVRLWSGVGEAALPADNVEPVEGALYRGVGFLSGLPQISALINGQADRLDFALPGVDEDIAALADSEAVAVRARAVHLGLLVLDADWQGVFPVRWLFTGVSDVVRVTRAGADPRQPVYQVGLSVGSRFTGRRRPTALTWSAAEQARLTPGDRAMDNVARYTQGHSKKWPRA